MTSEQQNWYEIYYSDGTKSNDYIIAPNAAAAKEKMLKDERFNRFCKIKRVYNGGGIRG